MDRPLTDPGHSGRAPSGNQIRELSPAPARLYYLDWLRVIAIFTVFVFHAFHAFDQIDWHIKNDEKSDLITIVFVGLISSWGIAMFFLISGASSWQALSHKSAWRYLKERVLRLFIPFVVGSALFSVIQMWFQFRHQGRYEGSLIGFVPLFLETRRYGLDLLTPKAFGNWGIHLWFLGFLFAFSVMAVPIIVWFRTGTGRRFVEWCASIAHRRGGLLLFAIPLIVVRSLVQPFFPEQHDWGNFVYLFGIFVLGALLFADERFAAAVRRDWRWMFTGGATALGVVMAAIATGLGQEWLETPDSVGFFIVWGALSLAGWCLSVTFLALGMRFLDYTNRLLEHSMEIIMPFYLLHQPIIIAIAFYVVQWNLNLYLKALIVLTCSFAVTMVIVEALARGAKPLRTLFGMSPARKAPDASMQSRRY
jgi:glucan biosynthesis protein C